MGGRQKWDFKLSLYSLNPSVVLKIEINGWGFFEIAFVHWALFFELWQHSKSGPWGSKICKHKLGPKFSVLMTVLALGPYHGRSYQETHVQLLLIRSVGEGPTQTHTSFRETPAATPGAGWCHRPAATHAQLVLLSRSKYKKYLSFYYSKALMSALISFHDLQVQFNYYYSESYTGMQSFKEKG